ncbi:hypothetical protein HYH03_013045 [Edaphochlamys debaryana]|uniref:EGF-like domain-containing protein n=1 Tax=Edaphochlamys debaryana TaxID=47281 RepID=A0A835XRI9_9CHLO|nr:hypothetical protein HYH03_013045 [Edaphochlamys debaryana]|eukprot:KAG2488355.1 hypothetical protein HYH03_013045 [Edaphochlamys debaryana]
MQGGSIGKRDVPYKFPYLGLGRLAVESSDASAVPLTRQTSGDGYDQQSWAAAHEALQRYAYSDSREGAAPPCDRSGGKCAVCALTRGSWCEEFFRQERVPWKPAPRGSKDCPSTKWGPCNGVGNCHYDIGVCQCPAGWKGKACDERELRYCSHRHKTREEPLDLVISHVDADGWDLDPAEDGWSASRCSGVCDLERSSCWCPPNTTYGRVPPPPDAAPWVRFSQKGRVLPGPCKARKVFNKTGHMVENDWGNKRLTQADIYGPQGWCNAASVADVPPHVSKACAGTYGCQEEGIHGLMCNITSEETCLNQCTGHGECDDGYCRCHKGWYGEDCARKKAGEDMEPGHGPARPWLRDVLQPVPAAATEPPSGGGAGAGPPGRLRPLIYVYDTPPEFTTRMHQYKLHNGYCGYREFDEDNNTRIFGASYSVEMYLHETLLLSPHRTFNPEEADFFYVPVYYTCWMWPVNGRADMPYWGAPYSRHRYSNAAHMWLAAKRWIQSHFPFWDRRGGRDHIWLTNHDEGACYMPTEIYNTSIMLTHWGRMDLHHISNTAYTADNYSVGLEWPGILDGQDVKTLYEGHPCYDPRKDLVIPGFKTPEHYVRSPLAGAAPYERDILLYFRGDVGKNRQRQVYSRGIRQRLYNLTIAHRWYDKHRIFIGTPRELVGDYSLHLARSLFCAVVPGDGYAMRFEDAVLHGCLPLIIMDRTHALFESILDIDSFSIRIKEAAVDEHLPSLLKSISPEQIERMQRKLALVWHRFAYAQGPLVRAYHSFFVGENRMRLEEGASSESTAKHAGGDGTGGLEQPPMSELPVRVDAFMTILQWLYGRIPDTRGPSEAIARYATGDRPEGAAPPCDRSGGKCALCALTRGSWCEEFFRQERVPWKPAPRGSKDCPSTKWGPCNGVGNCHYDIGVCQCPAGWQGPACDQPFKRPCCHRHKRPDEPLDLVISSIGPDGMDLDLASSGWSASRCSGFCDDERAGCWCPPFTKYGRKPPPPDSPPWVRFSERGRGLPSNCKAKKVMNKEGKLVDNDWGNAPLSIDDITGPKGWCNADTTSGMTSDAMWRCSGDCGEEGLHGTYCQVVSEESCLNQCSGHGVCDNGYCRCDKGWYGEDCARKKAGEEMEPGIDVSSRPWLKDLLLPVPAAAVEPPPAAAAAPEGGSGRLRPLIYVYDMPPEFTTRMHQYKLLQGICAYRQFTEDNGTKLVSGPYSIEQYLHESLMLSKHRTFDPEEADFFYVPTYFSCFTWPIAGKADVPFWGAPTSWHRYSNGANMWLAAKRWVQSHFPFWDRRGGRDHIWLTNHDEGACYMPTEIYNTSIMLTHWGRMDLDHRSNTAYGPDNYTQGIVWPGVLDGKNVRTLFDGHPCYDPRKDLVIPGFKHPAHFTFSPLLGAAPYERDILLYLRGDVGKARLPNYSRGLRQKLYTLSVVNHWAEKHRVYIGDNNEIHGEYSTHLARSVFCAVVPGDGYAMRFEDAVLHGCLPLIIMDRTHALFESILDIDSFSIRIKEAAVDEHLPNLLKSISPEQIERMQRKLALVWHRFAWAHGPLMEGAFKAAFAENARRRNATASTAQQAETAFPDSHPYQPVTRFPVHADAFATLMQWLHGRIADTRGPAEGGAG